MYLFERHDVCSYVYVWFNNHPFEGASVNPTDYMAYVQQYHAQQYQEQMQLYQQQYDQYQKLQQEYHWQQKNIQAQMASQQTPTSEPAVPPTSPPVPTPPVPPLPPTPPLPPARATPKPATESTGEGRGGWMPRAVALQAAVEMNMHSRIQHLLQSNRAYSTTFKAQLEKHIQEVRRWGRDPNYDFWRILVVSPATNLIINIWKRNSKLKCKFQTSKFEFKIWIQNQNFQIWI